MSEENNKNPYGFKFEELTDDQLLINYINAKQAVFLHGPSGIGKSSRVKQIDPNAVRITLRNQMNPEEIDGTLDRETGNFIPPLWYQQITEICAKEPEKTHVLFIDELTNVKPPVQSLVYSIVLDRAGKDGLWPLPENCTIVAAGNENADNLAAYPLTNALYRRFSHIYFEQDFNQWLHWALSIDGPNIHPAILAFLMTYEKNAFYQELDEENPQIVTDPRKWEMASKILYKTNNPYSLAPAIGEDLTVSFVDFVKGIQLTPQDIVNGNFDKKTIEEIKSNTAKKSATVAALTTATEKELPAVRNFIQKNIGKEQMKLFDMLWISGDKDKAMIIRDLNATQKEEHLF